MTQQLDLIDVPESLSPKLKFLIANKLVSKKTSNTWWKIRLETKPKDGGGRTEYDAIID